MVTSVSPLPNCTFQRGLQTLLSFLSKVKLPGDVESHSDGLWVGDTCERLHFLENWQNDPGLVAESKAFLQGLKDAGSLLARLQVSLVQATGALEKTLMPFELGRGLSSLPDDILSNIFEIVHAKCRTERHKGLPGKGWTHLKLSLVSRRFRDIVSNSPRLWNSPEGSLAPNVIEMFLAKSKGAGLKLSFSPNILCSDCTRRPLLYNLAIPHSERWEDLTMSFRFAKENPEKSFEFLASLHLSRLDSLSIDYSSDERPFQHFYKRWNLSTLRCFKILGAIPETFTAPLLTILTADIGSGVVNIQKLLEFLSANPTLEAIDIFLGRSEGDIPTEGSVLLENVKTFKMNYSDIYLFMERLRIPNVREVELGCYKPPLKSDSGRLNRALWCGSYPLLESFKLGESGGNDYLIPFHKMPNLRYLGLNTHNAYPLDIKRCKLPPIRELRIICDINKRWSQWLEAFHRLLEKQGKLSGFDKLTLCFLADIWGSEVPISLLLGLNRVFGSSRIVWDGYSDWLKEDLNSASEMHLKFLH